MNQEQFMGFARTMIALVSGWLVGHGYQTAADGELFSGFAIGLLPFVWSYMSHTDAAKIASVNAMPDEAKAMVAATLPDAAKIAIANAMPDEAKASVAATLPDSAKIAIAAAVPDVAQIVTTAEKASADPSPKVVSQ